MPTEELLTRWTIRLALVCYAAVLAEKLAPGGREGPRRKWARLLWTAGCGLFLAHVAAAFTFYHGWSHLRALEDTARQTKELINWEFGEGIYFSYLFTLLWVVDAAWWWLFPAGYENRGRLVDGSIHGFLLFIAFNGAIVFEGGVTRWVGAAACLGLAGLLAWKGLRGFGRDAPAGPLPGPEEASRFGG